MSRIENYFLKWVAEQKCLRSTGIEQSPYSASIRRVLLYIRNE